MALARVLALLEDREVMSDLMTRVTSGRPREPKLLTGRSHDLHNIANGFMVPSARCLPLFETCANLPLQGWLLLKCCLQPL